MAKFDLLTTLLLDTAGYTKGVDKARRSTQDLQKTAQNVGKGISSALSFVGIGASFAGVMALMKQGLESTGAGADLLEKRTLQVKGAVDALGQSIATADLANLGRNIRAAMKAAGEYADEMDILDQRTSDLSVRKSFLDAKIRELKALESEGKLTKAQAAELKKYNEEIYNLEIEITKARIDAMVKLGAERRDNGLKLDKEIFNDLQAGVIARSQLNQQELEQLSSFTDQYKEYYNKIVKENTKNADYVNMGPGMSNASTTMVTNWNAVTKAMNDYTRNLTDVQKVQIFEDMFSSPEEWQKVIGYFNELNMSMGEFNRNQKKLTTDKGTPPKPVIQRVEGVNTINTGGIPIPSFATPVDTQTLAKPAEVFKESWQDALTRVGTLAQDVSGSFSALGQSIADASEDGKVTFAEAMNVIVQTSLSAISILGALAAANIIAKEASKGVIGIFTAIAGLAMLAGLWKTFVKPKKMAAGGLVYSDSIVNVGEYAGASTNPEVIAPLDKLQGMLGMGSGEVVFRIGDNELIGILERNNRRKNSYK